MVVRFAAWRVPKGYLHQVYVLCNALTCLYSCELTALKLILKFIPFSRVLGPQSAFHQQVFDAFCLRQWCLCSLFPSWSRGDTCISDFSIIWTSLHHQNPAFCRLELFNYYKSCYTYTSVLYFNICNMGIIINILVFLVFVKKKIIKNLVFSLCSTEPHSSQKHIIALFVRVSQEYGMATLFHHPKTISGVY